MLCCCFFVCQLWLLPLNVGCGFSQCMSAKFTYLHVMYADSQLANSMYVSCGFSKCMSAMYACLPAIHTVVFQVYVSRGFSKYMPFSVVFQMYGRFRICPVSTVFHMYVRRPPMFTCFDIGFQKMYAAAVITFLQNVRRRRNVCQPFRNVCQLFRQVCPQMYVYLPHTNSNSPCFTVNACQPCVFSHEYQL